MINLLSVSEEAVVQVIQERILDENIRKVLSEGTINNIMTFQLNKAKNCEPLSLKIQELIEEIVPEGTGEVIIVPVLAKEHKGMIVSYANHIIILSLFR